MAEAGIVKTKGGKQYQMVVKRVNDFRTSDVYSGWSITTNTLEHDVGVQAIVKCEISDETGRVRATGMSWDAKDHSALHKTSYLELAETSAIGRALACLGLAGSTEYASADEVAAAILANEERSDANKKPAKKKVAKKAELKVVEKTEKLTEGDLTKHRLLQLHHLVKRKETTWKLFNKHWEEFKKQAKPATVAGVEKSTYPMWKKVLDAREK